MLGKAPTSGIRPLALGTTLNSSTYGSTIPITYGRMMSALYLIWEANVRQTGSKTKKKKLPTYGANVDFLIGHNPILTPLQYWMNQNQKLPLNFVTLTTGIFTGEPGNISYTIGDSNFYAVLAITYEDGADFGFAFNDYGALGPTSFAKIGPAPLWNAAFRGPDPTWPSVLRQGRYYYWVPSQGKTILFSNNLDGVMTIYYAQLDPGGSAQFGKKQSGTDIPTAALNLTFEPILGDGPEYTGRDTTSGANLAVQQIFYPSYAGLGSQNFQTGASGLPQVSVEILGRYNVNPGVGGGGDADFADIIEDIFKQGLSQPGFATDTDPLDIQAINTHPIQNGLGCYDFPGIVNAAAAGNVEFWNNPLVFFLPNVANNFLIAFGSAGTAGGSTFPGPPSDTAGDLWNTVIPAGYNGGMWWAKSVGSPALNKVTLSNVTYWWQANAIEIAGVDTFDASNAVVGGNSVSVTTTNLPGQPAYIIAFVNYGFGYSTQYGSYNTPVPGWTGITPPNNHYVAYFKVVYQPGTYTFPAPNNPVAFGTPNVMGIIAFKSTQPSPYPRPLTNIIDPATMDMVRAQCRAYGLWGSLVMDSQQKASDYLDVLYKAANAAPVWSGFKLKSIPYSEQSYAGNGSVYVSPTSTGPLAVIPAGDFIYGEDQPLYSVDRKAQVDVPNILQIQIPARGNDYNDVVVSQPMTAAVALFGSRKDSPQQFRCIVDPSIARMILNIQNNRRNNLRNTISFKTNAKWKLLEPMDLITLPADPFTGLPAIDVRITDAVENETYEMEFKAQPFVFGTNAPIPLVATAPSPYQRLGGNLPSVNSPIIFEPVPRMLNQSNQGQLWCVVSAPGGQLSAVTPTATPSGTGYQIGDVLTIVQTGASGGTITVTSVNTAGAITGADVTTSGINYAVANGLSVTGGHGASGQIDIVAVTATYAGCLVYLSTDGGNSYNSPIGTISGNGITGVSTADWPVANDPDSTNDLLLDLTESQGALASYQTQDEDDFNYPCYIAGGTTCIPYELMTYAVATLTSAFKYTLSASAGNHLRRSVFGAPQPTAGVDHPSGSRFAFLGPPGVQTQPGIFKLNVDPRWIGTTLYFKFVAFNAMGNLIQKLADATAYPYTPTGCPSETQNPNSNYVNTPAVALSRSSPTVVAMAQVKTQFPSNEVNYNARTFTIPAPSALTFYYVTIADPQQVGDKGTSTNLVATCQSSNALVGVPGNTYMGFIRVSPAGLASDLEGPGGWPAPFEAIVGA